MIVRFTNLTKRFGDVLAVDQVDMRVEHGEFVALLGPSGCGKTTTLLMAAGIYKPSEGAIRFDDQVMNRVPPKARNIGMVFQSYALYPHMTVYENIVFPLKLKKTPTTVMAERAKAVAEQMGIGHLLDRRPGQLSGGQQQRVALGRALVKEPDVLLFDEPLSNLDARLRLTMRAEIKRLQLALGITSIYVTHDQVEAMTMADRIAVMRGGRLEAFCPPHELYNQPSTRFVAEFVGNPPMNFLDVAVLRAENGAYTIHSNDIDLPAAPARAAKAIGVESVTLGIRPEDVHIVGPETSGGLTGAVAMVEPLGRDDLIEVRIGNASIHALADPHQRLTIGEQVRLRFDEHKMHFFDPKTGRSLLW